MIKIAFLFDYVWAKEETERQGMWRGGYYAYLLVGVYYHRDIMVSKIVLFYFLLPRTLPHLCVLYHYYRLYFPTFALHLTNDTTSKKTSSSFAWCGVSVLIRNSNAFSLCVLCPRRWRGRYWPSTFDHRRYIKNTELIHSPNKSYS